MYLRVPVAVIDDARVGGGEGDAHPARLRRQQHHEHVAAGVLEAVDRLMYNTKNRCFIEITRDGVGWGWEVTSIAFVTGEVGKSVVVRNKHE